MKPLVHRRSGVARVVLLVLLALVSTGVSLADVCASMCAPAGMAAGPAHACCRPAATASHSIERPTCTHWTRDYQDAVTAEPALRPERAAGLLALHPAAVKATAFCRALACRPATAALTLPAMCRAALPLPLRV